MFMGRLPAKGRCRRDALLLSGSLGSLKQRNHSKRNSMEIPSPSRSVRWVSALSSGNASILKELERRLHAYYSSNAQYYEDIDFTRNAWHCDPVYLHIAAAAKSALRVVEFGCGSANLLHAFPEVAPRYTGMDFSAALMERNRAAHPAAAFHAIDESRPDPLPEGAADLVFSVFVIEHCVWPHVTLRHWLSKVRPGGRLMVLCPDFLGSGRLSSQRLGFTRGTGSQKLKAGRWLDALVTAYDHRVRVPLIALLYRGYAMIKPRFLINMAPLCFTDPFVPDVDAVYVTYGPEMRSWLRPQALSLALPPKVEGQVKRMRWLLLDLVKQ